MNGEEKKNGKKKTMKKNPESSKMRKQDIPEADLEMLREREMEPEDPYEGMDDDRR